MISINSYMSIGVNGSNRTLYCTHSHYILTYSILVMVVMQCCSHAMQFNCQQKNWGQPRHRAKKIFGWSYTDVITHCT